MVRTSPFLILVLVLALGCGERINDAESPGTSMPPSEFSGEWSDACAAWCEELDACREQTDEWCYQACLDEQFQMGWSCLEPIGEVMWCGAYTSCEQLEQYQHFADLIWDARESVDNPCRERALAVPDGCCV